MTQEKVCANKKCRATTSVLFRKGWTQKDGNRVWLCNPCGLVYRRNHYCPYCYQIYREADLHDLYEPWIECIRCSRCVHVHCEKDLKITANYLCPDCRNGGNGMNGHLSCHQIKKRRRGLNNQSNKFKHNWTFHQEKVLKKKRNSNTKYSLEFILNRSNDSEKNGLEFLSIFLEIKPKAMNKMHSLSAVCEYERNKLQCVNIRS